MLLKGVHGFPIVPTLKVILVIQFDSVDRDIGIRLGEKTLSPKLL